MHVINLENAPLCTSKKVFLRYSKTIARWRNGMQCQEKFTLRALGEYILKQKNWLEFKFSGR